MTKEKELKLTIKQEAFARAYVETGNASEAYRRAYDAARMKPEVIAVKASEFCDKVEAFAATTLGVTFYDLPEG